MTLNSFFIKKYSSFYLSLIFFILIFPILSVGEQQKPVLNVVFHNDHHPISFELPDGRPAGMYVDLWRLWSITTGTPVNFISESMEDGLLLVKTRNTVHSGLFKNEIRQLWADFSMPIHRVESSIVYNKKGNTKKNLEEFNGMTVAVIPGTYYGHYLFDNYPNIKVVPFRGESSVHDLMKGEIQAIFNESPSLHSLLARMGLGSVLESTIVEGVSSLVHAAVAKGQPLLINEINRGFKSIPIHELVALEKKWLPNTDLFFNSEAPLDSLTLSERDWLQMNRSFSVGVHHNSYPFEFIDDNNNLSGISADYVDFISKQLNIQLNIVQEGSWAQSFEALKAGEIDIMLSMVRTDKREESMLFSKPYFELPSVVVTKKGGFYAESMSSLNHNKVGVITGHFFAELIERDYPNIKLVYVSSVIEGLKLLNKGKLDAYIGVLPTINHEIDREHYLNLIIASFTPYKLEPSIAVRLGLEPLVPTLNKALDSMDIKSKSIISNNWLAVRIQEGTKLKTILKWAIPILTFFIFIMLISIAVNRKLKREIIQRQLLEQELLQSNKMKALGEMAGGIAHDFNNMMGIIMGNSELLKMKFPTDEKIQKFNNNIYKASTRATELVSQIMTFSSMSKPPLVSLNFLDVIHDCIQLIKSTAPENIEILWDVEDGFDYVGKGNITQINQVLINLSTNAIDAISPHAGVLEFKLSGSNIPALNGLGDNKSYFTLKVKDSGCGIDKSIINNIFDPFFSTKAVGKGTGLGLSVVYNIINGHNGNISVVNNEQSGVEFTIQLPKTLEAPLNENPEARTEHMGQGHILIAEDEEDLNLLYREYLESSGYVVTTCKNGKEALAVFKNNPKGYDLLLTDHSMPTMTGAELIEAVLKINADIPIILATGYADITSTNKIVSKNSYKCLVKPIKRNVLLETVYRCINVNGI